MVDKTENLSMDKMMTNPKGLRRGNHAADEGESSMTQTQTSYHDLPDVHSGLNKRFVDQDTVLDDKSRSEEEKEDRMLERIKTPAFYLNYTKENLVTKIEFETN